MLEFIFVVACFGWVLELIAIRVSGPRSFGV